MPRKDKEAYRAYKKIYSAQRSAEYHARVRAIAERHGCRLCPERDSVVLEFHHIDPRVKEFGVADGVVKCFAWHRIAAEIGECVVLCANCHKRVHAGMLVVNESMLCDPHECDTSSSARMVA